MTGPIGDQPRTASRLLPPSQVRLVDQVCDAFEAAWRGASAVDQRPQIEHFLAENPEADRALLFRELLGLDLAYRRQSGEEPTPNEYRARFPDQAAVIIGIFTTVLVPERAVIGAAEATTLPPKAALEPATDWPRIPGFTILERFPGGGMGIIYRAYQKSLNRIVCLKMVRSGEYADPQELARFRVEAGAVARLSHPHIVPVFDFGEHHGLPFFAMEFIGGGSLADRLARGPLPIGQAAALVETLARAMDYAHREKIIHRDLKPANILLQGTPETPLDRCVPKIADFGLAKCLDDNLRLTETKAVMGTASYMAPEQAAGRTQDIGFPSDVYALGAILYETLTGRPPFLADTRDLTRFQVQYDDPVPPNQHRSEVPAPLQAICLKCLEKERSRRYPSALALAEDLRRFQAGEALAIDLVEDTVWQPPWARRAGYEILDLIGCSILGMVYKARQVNLNRLVTLKTISAEAQANPAKRERFHAEAATAARLHHPNFVQIYDFGEQSGQPYFSLEFLDGGSLAEQCRGEPVPAARAAGLIETLARAVHYAHQQGIVHTDLRPFNVLLTAAGVPKIIGFGLAQLLEEESAAAANPARRGLSNYIAPEQATGRAKAIGPAADIHALGAMLYEMLTGQAPFAADTVQATLERIQREEAVPPTRLQPDIPPALEAVCLRCLRKEPAQRYPDAETLADDLRHFLMADQGATDEFDLVPGYEFLEELGRGGTGVVYKARQIALDRAVALKVFRERLGRILAASRAVAGLQHPNLVQVYDCGEREGLLYVAEELVQGSSLDQVIATGLPPPQEAARVVETLARALHYVHGHGIVHRNLKPRVVLLTTLGIPKISSFDLAKLPTPTADDMESEGQIIGTPNYMSPEQAAGQVGATGPATDVHGLGVILYELLTGRPPVAPGPAHVEVLDNVRFKEPVAPRSLRPEIPRALEVICLKCLRKAPAQRYPTAEALAEDLRRFLMGGRWGDLPATAWQKLVGWSRRLGQR
jgi:serine/threonine protein kinase